MKEAFQRIIEIIEYYKLNPNSFCEKIGFGYTTFMNYNSGIRSPNNADLYFKTLSTFVDISAEWLIRGEGDMIKSYKEANQDIKLINLLEKMQEKMVNLAEENGSLKEKIETMRKKNPYTQPSIRPSVVADNETEESKQ